MATRKPQTRKSIERDQSLRHNS